MTALKDDKEFRSLDPQRWEDLCYLLFKEEYVGLHRVNGSGGDEGIDAYVGTFDNPTIVFQFKFFSNGFASRQVRQIKDSLEKALEKRSGFKWILACSADPTTTARRALDKVIEEHQDVEIEVLGECDMKSKLLKHPGVRRCYYDDGVEAIRGALSLGDMDPLKRAREGVRIYNDSIIDERFHATVTTDGKSFSTTYTLHPDFADVSPTFSITLKSKNAVEAYRRLIQQGIPLELSGEEVAVGDSGLPGIPADDASLQSLTIVPHCDSHPAQLRFYSSEEEGNHQTLFVDLRTEREGTECIVRSNSHQKNAPVVFQLLTPAG
uniref:restriction endonuclease n=1 Tax=Thermophilibacter provencensis TaxID=1852386 RepID=UPI003AA8C0C9